MHPDPIIQLAISKGILKADSLSAIESDKNPIDFLITNGILQQQQVDELRKELLLAAQETAIATRRIQNSLPSASKDRIAVFGRYTQLEFIGQGGMARVFKAFDPALGRTVALKFVRVDDPQMVDRLLIEARAQARVEHEHVCKIYDTGEIERKPYICMQYIRGQMLKDLQNELSLKDKVRLIRQVAEGVHAAHRAGLIHRDLKPSNILVEQKEVGLSAYVMDFGLAREIHAPGYTLTGVIMGTPSYMSPEQARGQTSKVNARTDIYSIGATLYDLIAGIPPFDGPNPMDILMNVIEKEPVPVRKINTEIPEDLETIVMKCLEKDQERRYDSARSLSEDLSRFLDGDPVLAKPTTWTYRTKKRIRKNPVVSGLLAAAVLAILLFAGIAGFVQWRANQQAKFLQEFGQEAARIEGIMRFAYLLPLHNIKQETNQVEERLRNLEQRMKVLGTQASGPGNYALGRGYLALHRYKDANNHLMQAWNEYSYREPHVAYALGYSLSMLYREKLKEAEQTVNKEQLQFRKVELEKTYRDPALNYIQQGASTSEAPEFVEAILAFLGKDYSHSLQKAEAASKKITWLYEAKKLEGDVYTTIANDHRESGNSAAALDQYQKAKLVYIEAAKKGQSDADIYEGLCALQSNVVQMQITQSGISPENEFKEGLSYCQQALQIETKSIQPNVIAAKLYRDFAYYQRNRGQDCSDSLNQAVQHAKAALNFDPDNASAYLVLGKAFSSQAEVAIQKKQNPLRYLELADDSFKKAVIKTPKDAEALFDQGDSFLQRGTYEAEIGKDPRASLDKATSMMEKAIEINPKNAFFYGRLGVAYFTIGQYEIDNGLDAEKSLEHAIAVFRKSNEINPKYLNGYIFTASGYLYMSDAQSARGEDPSNSIDQAISTYDQSLKIDPQNAYSYFGLGYAYWKKGNFLQESGQDPTSVLGLARDALQKSLSFNDQILQTYAIAAETELVAARNALEHQQPPEKYFDDAEKIIKRVLAMNNKSYESLGSLTSLCLLRATYLQQSGRSIANEVERGLKAADQALQINPQMAEVFGTRGKLFLLRAQSSLANDRIIAAQKAEEAFVEATKIKASLNKLYAKDLEEARKLGSHE
jgi:eukaryotic-like serine/threonine-protein kinase